MKYLKIFESKDYVEITLSQFIDDLGHIENNIGILKVNLNKSTCFNLKELDLLSKYNKNNYEVSFRIFNKRIVNNYYPNLVTIKDTDMNRESINPNYTFNGIKYKGKNVGNTDLICIYKGNDDYYYVSLVRTNVIPLGENTKLSTFFNNGMYFKCDQLSGLNQLLRKLLS